eukprot:jgi/Ulvmu1/3403/UM016_0020.1
MHRNLCDHGRPGWPICRNVRDAVKCGKRFMHAAARAVDRPPAWSHGQKTCPSLAQRARHRPPAPCAWLAAAMFPLEPICMGLEPGAHSGSGAPGLQCGPGLATQADNEGCPRAGRKSQARSCRRLSVMLSPLPSTLQAHAAAAWQATARAAAAGADLRTCVGVALKAPLLEASPGPAQDLPMHSNSSSVAMQYHSR